MKVTTEKVSYSQEEIKAARQAIGSSGTTEQLSERLKGNRSQQTQVQAEATKQQNAGKTVGTKYVNSAATKEKIRTIARTKPEQAKFLQKSFGVAVEGLENLAGTVNEANRTLDRHTRNVMQTLFSIEVVAQDSIAAATESATSAISDLKNDVVHDINGLKQSLNKTLQPVSSAVGQTLGNLTNVVADPLGAPFAIGRSVGSLIDKVNPGFTNRLDATYKKYKVIELQNLPGQIMGSVRNLAALADAILSFPFQLAADLYNGLMEIMQEISDLIDSVITAVFDFFFGPGGVLDSIFPISEMLAFLEEVAEFASIVGSISQLAGGFNMVTNIASQVGSYSSQASSMLSNPAQLAMSYMPNQVTSTLNMVRNPGQLLESLIPSSVFGQLKQISNVPGLGFVGNMGYSLQGTLNGLSQGVFTQALNQLEEQAGILAPLFNMPPKALPVENTQEASPPAIVGASTNPSIPTAQGVPVVLDPPPPVLPTKQSSPETDKASQQGAVTIGNPSAAFDKPLGTGKVGVTIPKDMQFSPNSIGSGIVINNPQAANIPVKTNVSVTIPNSLKFP